MTLNYLIPFALYAAVASPSAYKLTRKVAGSWVASADGLATTAGLLFHALVFVIVVGYLMRLLNPRRSGYGDLLSGVTSWGKSHETHRSGLGEMDDSPNIQGFDLATKI
jgi:hypothetical protein